MKPNPYDPPSADNVHDVLDRAHREKLIHTIGQFLNGQSSAFEFHDALDEYCESADPTVRFVVEAVWYHYDDCDDHMITLSKQQWDYFQRLILLLRSDRQIAISFSRRWSWTQLLRPAGCLLGFAWCVLQYGWGQHLLAFSIPFGFVSIFISVLRNHARPARPYDRILSPFPAFADLSAAYKATPRFRKERYPAQILAKRRIRSPVAEFGVLLQMYAGWLMLSPIPLLAQTFPITETEQALRRHDKQQSDPNAASKISCCLHPRCTQLASSAMVSKQTPLAAEARKTINTFLQHHREKFIHSETRRIAYACRAGIMAISGHDGVLLANDRYHVNLNDISVQEQFNAMLQAHGYDPAREGRLPPGNCAEAHLWMTLTCLHTKTYGVEGHGPRHRHAHARHTDLWVYRIDRKYRLREDSPCDNCRQWSRQEFNTVNGTF